MLSTLNVNDLFSGDGSNRDWTYSFQILTSDGSDIQIWLTSPEGVVSQVTASYSINVTTSTVTYPTIASLMDPVDTGWTVELRRVTPKTQAVDLVRGGSFSADTLEGAIDKCTAIAQEIKAQLNDIVTANTTPAQLATLIAELNNLVATATILAGEASDSKDAAAISATEALASEAAALLSETKAAASAASALAAIPTIESGDGYKVLQAKSDETGYELTAGNTAHRPVILNSSGKLPAVDGSLLTNLKTFPPTVFDVFAGNGEDGEAIINADANFSLIDSAIAGRAQFETLTVAITKTLTIDTGVAVIGVSGTLTIHGTISADAQGAAGGTGGSAAVGNAGNRPDGAVLTARIPFCLSGSSGGGGESNGGTDGGSGAGAGAEGGAAGTTGDGGNSTATNTAMLANLKAAGLFPFMYKGAGGGAGGGEGAGSGGAGGAGGGVIYIECNELVYDGVITADGGVGIVGSSACGSGGGGGGGVIFIRAKILTTNTGTTTVTGGTGGASAGGGGHAGGNGANGYSLIVEVA
jgi:hypothetical protein